MDSITVFRLFILVAILTSFTSANTSGIDFITSSCKITCYPDVCVASLKSYAASLQAKQSQSALVKAAVIVSLANAQNTLAWIVTLSRNSNGLNKLEVSAVKDCVENFDDTSDQISQSLTELKHLKHGTFNFQMSNVQTWMSAALTNEDSCLNGFQAVGNGKVKMLVQGRVQNSTKLMAYPVSILGQWCTLHPFINNI